ncbi:hypothetical protein M3J09_003479 [Ascochyta lentis]
MRVEDEVDSIEELGSVGEVGDGIAFLYSYCLCYSRPFSSSRNEDLYHVRVLRHSHFAIRLWRCVTGLSLRRFDICLQALDEIVRTAQRWWCRTIIKAGVSSTLPV